MIVQLGQSTSAPPDSISVADAFIETLTFSSGAMAVLDALPAHIAVLDANGMILAVNRAWREFASSFAMTLPGYGVGTNYISVCGTASENGAAEGRDVADGIRSVINGERDVFILEYPCKCAKESRWYLLRILPIPHALPAALLVAHEDITARKLAELGLVHSQEQLESKVIERTAALARSEVLHRHIIESLPGGVIQIASDGLFMGANAEGLKFLGMSMDSLTHRTIPDFEGETFREDGSLCPMEDYPASRCLATGLPQAAVTIGVKRHDQTMVWAVFTAVPVACPIHPGRTGTVVTFLNITLRKQAEDALRRSDELLRQAHEQLELRVIQRTAELAQTNAMLREQIAERTRADLKLRESEERFREMADNIGEVVWVQDSATGKILYISPAYESIWGRSCQSMYDSAASFLDAVLPDDLPIAIECMRRQAFESYDAVYRIRDRRGEIRWVRSRSSPIRDAAGKTLRVTGIAEDITDLKAAEAELSRLALIVESSDDAIIGKSLDGTIVSWNSGAERIYGYSAQEMLGRECNVLVPPQDWPTVVAQLKGVGRGERIETFEAIRVRKNGSPINISVTLSSVKDSAGNIIGSSEIERDITERKRLEQEVLLISDRERRRIGQDLHDGLGQHLTGIAFLSKSLQQRLASKAISGAAATSEESAEAGRIAELVQQAVGQTRALARGLHPVETSANGLMAALNDLATRVGSYSKVECTFECEASVPVADNVVATHLYRIAQESVTNAIKHANTKRIRITLHTTGGKLKLIVEDEGVGISDVAGSPLGLGMRIMRYRAKMIGGILTIACGEKCGVVVACEVSTISNCGEPGKQEIP